MSQQVLPYLAKMAKGGDADALAVLRKMRDDGDDDAAQTLDDLGDGNGASPDDPIEKAEGAAVGDLFDVGYLDAALATAEPFAKSEDAPDPPPAADAISAQPEVQAAMQMDAGDFVQALVKGIEAQLDQLGNTALWGATGTEALAKAQIALGESFHAMAGEHAKLNDRLAGIETLLNGRGAGVQGASTATGMATRAAPLAKAFDGGGKSPATEHAELRKSLRARRDAEMDPARSNAIRSALEDLSVGQLDSARVIMAAG